MPETPSANERHVLDFFCDDENSCALTIVVNGVRFHILADANEINRSTEAGAEYHGYVDDLKSAQPDDTQSQDDSEESDRSVDRDSGVDVKDGQKKASEERQLAAASYDVEDAIKQWMVAPLADSFAELAPAIEPSERVTLQAWYHCPTRFYELAVSEDGSQIEAVELDATPGLLQRIEELIPGTSLPKYISDKLDAPIYEASELYVVEGSDQPPGTPYHPCKVQHSRTEKRHFLKVVDNTQPQATKREIDILRRIKHLALDRKFRIPSVEGLVSFDTCSNTPSGKKRIMGFLMTDIPDPTPLTMMLNSGIPQEKRDAWAKEVEEIKDLLHQHNIVWGDAKADNFVVDKHENLWIIDFGGGYTEGWIEPQFNETEEGDDVATEKIVNALHDPAENVLLPSDDSSSENETQTLAVENDGKRKRGDETEDEDEENRVVKSRRSRVDEKRDTGES